MSTERYAIRLRVNARPVETTVSPRDTLLQVLRRLHNTEVKDGCGRGECGTCVVLLDGSPVNACLVLAVDCNGSHIATTTGRGTVLSPSHLQRSLAEGGGVQCGFCIPGLVNAVTPLISRQAPVTADDVRMAMDGHLCRCTGYVKPIEVIEACCGSAPPPLARREKPGFSSVGHRVTKRDSLAMACGTALYTDDHPHPGALVLKTLGSDVAHARVTSVDRSEALLLEGVVSVLTCFDVPAGLAPPPDSLVADTTAVDNVLLTRQPRFVGDRLAAVVARSEEAATAGCAALKVTYDELPAIFSTENGEVAGRLEYETGAVGDTSTGPQTTYRETFEVPAASQCFAEPYACVTSLDEGGRLVVRTSTQVPYFVRWAVSAFCDVPIARIRIIRPCVGAGFGAKQDAFVEPLCALATLETGKPVRYVFERHEVFRCGRHRHPTAITIEVSSRHGRFETLDMDVTLDTGAYACHANPVLLSTASRSLPLYRWQHVLFRGKSVLTNRPPAGGFRGYGAPQSFFALESAVDELAAAAGCCPLQFRLDNVIDVGDSLHIINDLARGDEAAPPTVTSSSLKACIRRGAELIGWNARRAAPPSTERLRRGVGMALAMQAPTAVGYMLSSATIKLNEDGSFTLLSGAADIGTGAATALAQIAAEMLTVPSENIVVVTGDTDLAPFDSGAYSSSTTWNSGSAVQRAATEVIGQILAHGARLSGRRAEALRLEDGAVVSDDGLARFSFAHIAQAAIHTRAQQQISATASHAPRNVPPSFIAQFAEVEVDTWTGVVRPCHLVSVLDCGRAINPTIVEGQLQGAMVMALGTALTEELTFTDDGVMRNPNLSTYQVLRAPDIPAITVELVESETPGVPFGAKSVGEIGTMPLLAAVGNALAHATGCRLRRPPFTPWRVLEALSARGIQPSWNVPE